MKEDICGDCKGFGCQSCNGTGWIEIEVVEKPKEPKEPCKEQHLKTPEADKIPEITYENLHLAFKHFNKTLFQNTLPSVMFTLTVRRKTRGFFRSQSYAHKHNGHNWSEIALNPDSFNRPSIDILSTLAHEMCHLWRSHTFQKEPTSYHDSQWAKKMVEIGLPPFNIRNPEKKTGNRCSHKIDKEGNFSREANFLIHNGLSFYAIRKPDPERQKKMKKTKVCYECPNCESKVWAKPGLKIACVDIENHSTPYWYWMDPNIDDMDLMKKG